jgi:hypothetical protein
MGGWESKKGKIAKRAKAVSLLPFLVFNVKALPWPKA